MRNREPNDPPEDFDPDEMKVGQRPPFDYRNLPPVTIIQAVGVVFLVILTVGMFTGACNGPEGLQGFPGIPGEVGPVGPPGDLTVTSGPPGATGDTGAVGDAGAAGATGPAGPQGPEGAQGPIGDISILEGPEGPPGPEGPRGFQGPNGEDTFVNGSPTALANPNVNHILFFEPTGVLVENAGNSTTTNGPSEIPNRASQRTVDFYERQIVRAQFAHNLQSESIKLQVQFWRSTGVWATLIDAFGSDTVAFSNQTSEWFAIPRFEGNDFLVRVIVHGNGELDPRITYVELDVR